MTSAHEMNGADHGPSFWSKSEMLRRSREAREGAMRAVGKARDSLEPAARTAGQAAASAGTAVATVGRDAAQQARRAPLTTALTVAGLAAGAFMLVNGRARTAAIGAAAHLWRTQRGPIMAFLQNAMRRRA
jgi:hypothetical protein